MTDLLRVDVLNTIGVSMMLLGVMCWAVISTPVPAQAGDQKVNVWGQPPPAVQPQPQKMGEARPTDKAEPSPRLSPLILASTLTATLISLATPLLWTTWRPSWLPWPIESYIDGVHNVGTPQPALFPIFPWTAFAFAGLAVGFILQTEWSRAREARIFFVLGGAGIVMVELARWLDRQPRQLYAVYDYWHTSPNFFLIRVGMLLMILCGAYVWCRWVIGKWGVALWGFSPLIQLGQASLLVYWVHIEFVYGRVSILPKHAESIRTASVGLLIITLAMLALAYARTKAKGRPSDLLSWLSHHLPRSAPRRGEI
jgi:uncharacterized membrane protein